MNIENIKNMAKIQSLGVLFLISETLAAQQYAQPIGKTFPCLTALTSSRWCYGEQNKTKAARIYATLYPPTPFCNSGALRRGAVAALL